MDSPPPPPPLAINDFDINVVPPIPVAVANAPPPPPQLPPAPCPVKKKMKFTFNDDTKLLLLSAVQEHKAHVADHGHQAEKMKNVLNTFIENIPSDTWLRHEKPKVKTLSDKLRAMMKERKQTNEENTGASGIAEDVTDVDELLDDLLDEKSEFEESKKKEKQELNQREEALIAAGEDIRNKAIRHKSTEADPETPKPKRRKVMDLDDDSEWNEKIENHLKRKREQEDALLQLKREELELQKERWEEEKKEKQMSLKERDAHLKLISAFINKMN